MRDGKRYYLQALLEVPKKPRESSDRGELYIRWHGRLDLPPVCIPNEPQWFDPTTLGSLIDDLGAKVLAQDDRVSTAAARELSLIDDPRVIPWYVEAMNTDSYSLKFNALDRLSRLEGDDALEGLKIGMATQGEDIANCTTPELAEESAGSIRHAAAKALARVLSARGRASRQPVRRWGIYRGPQRGER